MRWLSRLVHRVRHLIHRRRAEREMEEEMRFHVEMEARELIQQGVQADEARRQALVAFGGVERFKEAGRDARGLRVIEDVAQDVRYATRTLARTPGFSIAAVITLALGIAATTAVVSAVNALFLRPLPVHEPDRLVVVHEIWRNGNVDTDMAEWRYPYERYLAYREATGRVFTGVAGFQYAAMSVRSGNGAQIRSGIIASERYFHVLGVRPALGRLFSEGGSDTDRIPHAEPIAPEIVIGYDLWQREFAGDPTVLGHTLYIDSRPMTVVGVAPKGFNGTIGGLLTDLWIPAAVYRLPPPVPDSASTSAEPRDISLTIFGRLRPGISREHARAMLELLAPHLSAGESRPPEIRDVQLDAMTSLPAMARGDTVGFIALLSLTAALVLLIAATNVAGMLLARAMYRRREIAVRRALGAGRGRIIRQLLAESMILCVAGAAAGVLIAQWLIGLIPAVQPAIPIRVALDLSLDRRALAIALSVAVAAGMLAGLVPALQATRRDLSSTLHGAPDGKTPLRSRLRTAFVVAQFAMSLVLLITAGLFVRALQRGLATDPGFDPAGVVEAGVDLAPHGYDTTRAPVFYAQLMEQLRARPEVMSATLARWTPLSGYYNGAGIPLPGEPANGGGRLDFLFALVDAGYFQTMRVPIIEGRAFTTADAPDAAPVVIVNDVFAKRFWPNESPIGQSLRLVGTSARVVGVARDQGKGRGLDDDGHAWAYLPFAQHTWLAMTIYVRARGDAGSALAAVRHEVAALNPNIALAQPRTLSSQLDVYLLPQRLAAWLVGAFGLVGLALASMGIYGVLAFHVAQRTREFGIRRALGARGADVVRDVLTYALRIVVLATLIGVALALAAGRLAQAFLFGVGVADPVTLIAVPLLLSAVALLASYIPARRAATVDPMESLRAE